MLQQFDFNVDKAVQAFVDGRWNWNGELIKSNSVYLFSLNELSVK